jgi:hypothetical protein
LPISTTRVHSKLKFIPQTFNPLVLKLVHWSLPIVLRLRLQRWLPAGIERIEAINVETLVDLYSQFQTGTIRFLIAFRHCEVDDPLCGLYLFSRAIPQVARQKEIALEEPVHAHFMYDRGMPLWAGNWLGWLFSNLGGIPIHRGRRLDRNAMRTARDLLVNGKLPLVVAPEGATNGHSEIVSPLEPGTAQLGFWCVEDLQKANRSEEVFIVPIGIQYRYCEPDWSKLNRLLSKMEADSGLRSQQLGVLVNHNREMVCYQRLLRLGEHLLDEMEEFYRRFYHQHIPQPNFSDPVSREQILESRLQTLLDVALQVAEQYFNLSNRGNIIERCRRLEEAGWSYIYREDISDLRVLSPLQKGLGNWVAQEADLRMHHMRLVESFVAVTKDYIREKPSFERLAETALIIFDLLARIKENKIPRRPRLGWRQATLTVGEPISVSDRWKTYQQSRQAARRAVAQLTQELQTALENMIS